MKTHNRVKAVPQSPGRQPIRPAGMKYPTSHPHGTQTRSAAQTNRWLKAPHSATSELEAYKFLQEQQARAKQEADQVLQNRLGAISANGVRPATFVTTAATGQSLESYAPTDPRANAMASVGASGGFLPPPPIA